MVDPLVNKLSEVIQKKNKGGVAVKPFQIKNHLWVFINCLIENPSFDSQTKENMTLKERSFGSKCNLSEKFIKSVCLYKHVVFKLVTMLVCYRFFLVVWWSQFYNGLKSRVKYVIVCSTCVY